jgi:hypothetical protein
MNHGTLDREGRAVVCRNRLAASRQVANEELARAARFIVDALGQQVPDPSAARRGEQPELSQACLIVALQADQHRSQIR